MTLYVFAQQPSTIHLTEKDGLPDIEFYDILEDNEGFIWLAADKGLFRYDGETFKRFTNNEVRGRSMFELKMDSKGRVWCVNISGQFFYVENDTLITFIDVSTQLGGVLADYELYDDHLLVFGRSFIIEVDLQTAKFKTLQSNETNLAKPLQTKERLLMSLGTELALFNGASQEPQRIAISSIFETKGIEGKLRLFEVEESFYAILRTNKKNEFYTLNFALGTYTPIETPKKLVDLTINRIFNKDNQLIFSTNKGAHVYELEKEVFIHKGTYLPNKYTTNVLIDKDQNYWFSTLRSGVFVMPNIHVQRFEIPNELQNSSKLEKIDEETLFFGTVDGGLGLFNIEDQKLIQIKSSNKRSVSALLFDKKENKMLIGVDNSGLIYDVTSGVATLRFDFMGAKSFSIISKDSLLQVKGSVIFIADIANPDKGQYLLENKRGYDSYHDAFNKKTYIAAIDNFKVYDSKMRSKIINYKGGPIAGISITQTQDETVWVGSFKNGLYAIDNDRVVAHYKKMDGLSANEVTHVAADGNNLWITTDGGIQFFDSGAKTFKTLTKNDGIPSYKISGIEIFKNRAVFSSNVGLFAVDKNNAFRKPAVSDVYLQSVAINEQEVPPATSYTLEADEKKIKFDFHTNNFQNLENIVYQYRLKPETTAWTTLEKGVSNVQFNNLTKGKYTLELRAKNTFSENYSAITTVPFTTTIAVWEEVWFLALLIFLTIGLVALYFRSISKRKQKKQELALTNVQVESQLTSLKLENLRSQMNPHFIFNALNSIQEYIVLNQRTLASDYLGRFADLVRTYLKHSNKGEITLQEEIDCLEMYLDLEKMRFEEKLAYSVTVAAGVYPEDLLIPTMLIQPYVENAIKHGLLHKKIDRKLWVRFYLGNDTNVVICEVEDNGVGRERAMEFQKKRKSDHESFATKATDDRLALINNNKNQKIGITTQDLCDAQNNPLGTKISITIPYKKD